MRIFFLTVLLFALWPSNTHATVIEFDIDGSVTTYEASDYLALNRHRRMKPQVSFSHLSMKSQGAFDNFIISASQKNDVAPKLIRAIIHVESAFMANATSNRGAAGLMQIMPATAKKLGIQNVYDPKQNIEGGTKFLKYLLTKYGGNRELALAAYNAGEGAVDKYGGIPPYSETIQYVEKIESLLQER